MRTGASSRNAMSVHWIYRLSICSEWALWWHSVWNHSTDGVCFLNTVDHACTLLEYVKVLSRGKWSKNCTASLWKLWLRQDFVLAMPVWNQPGANFTELMCYLKENSPSDLPTPSISLTPQSCFLFKVLTILNHTDKRLSGRHPAGFLLQ